jgi:hypothetical protein
MPCRELEAIDGSTSVVFPSAQSLAEESGAFCTHGQRRSA